MFITEDFLLTNEISKRLYHDYAKELPIIDYHCHLDPALIAGNQRFDSITDLWLAGDHYKWRAMRANGVAEKFITGSASDWEKFAAWGATVENLVGNPLYHWTHLELKNYFGIHELLTAANAKAIYDHCQQVLANKEMTAVSLVKAAGVQFIGTTDDPLSSLEHHHTLQERTDFMVAPSFRPDPFLNIELGFAEYLEAAENVRGYPIEDSETCWQFIQERLRYFQQHGCKSADHGLTTLSYASADPQAIETIFQKARQRKAISEKEKAQWQTYLLTALATEYQRCGWIMQIHFGALRNNNSRLQKLLGPDIGTDTIMDQAGVARALNQLLAVLDQQGALPKTILYNLNPQSNAVVAAACGNFQGNELGIKSKLQFGAAWWFNDTYRGIWNQLETLSDQGILMHFIGMLTDSRSFLSYPRHEYFRRIFCEFVGQKVASGFYPADETMLKRLVQNVSYYNAKSYFDLG